MIEITVMTGQGPLTCSHNGTDTLLQTLQYNDIHLPAPCGGLGKCGKCAVGVSDETSAGPRLPDEERYAPSGSGKRLACRAVPVTNLTITLPDGVVTAANDSTAKGGAFVLPAAGIPVARSVTVLLQPPSLTDQRSVHQRLIDEIGDDVTVSLSAVSDAAKLMAGNSEPREAAGLVVSGASGDLLIAVDDLIRETLPAVAVDIGTTTIAAYLIDLASHRVLAVRSEENQQGRFGADVVSRITSAAEGRDLTSVVRDQISAMMESLCQTAGLPSDDIVAAAVVGNPTMTHLLLGLDPEPIGRSPFMPLSVETISVPMSTLGLPAHKEAEIVVAPGLSAYVGADIVADVLTSRINESEELSLLIDIGTNGEMILGDSRGLVACSTAAGPAFEGANIKCGSGGIPGAVDSVRREADRLVIGTIGDEPPRSICGSGLLDLVAQLLEDGIVDETGRLDLDAARDIDAYKERVLEADEAILIDAGGDGGPVMITQGDLRQVQLAKGAIAAGVRTLLEEANVQATDLVAVYLAGGFGTYVRPESALRTGLLPPIPVERIVAIGNAAGAGAARLLVDGSAREAAKNVVAESRYIELSRSQTFQNFFMEEMMFP